MNIFVLDKDPIKAAEYHNDKHVVKMILESAQLLCNAHHYHFPQNSKNLYRPTHFNHPCSVWVRQSSKNYQWLFNLWIALLKEYNLRYGKRHKCEEKIIHLSANPCPIGEITSFAQAMPDQYRDDDVVKAYRNYYRNEKFNFSRYYQGTKSMPDWMVIEND